MMNTFLYLENLKTMVCVVTLEPDLVGGRSWVTCWMLSHQPLATN